MNEDRNLELAIFAMERNNPARALQHLAESPDLQDIRFWATRAVALNELGQHDQAIDACRRGLQIDATNVPLRRNLSRAYRELGRFAEAETAILSVLNEDPNDAISLYQYGWLLATVGDTAGARDIIARMPDWLSAGSPDGIALRAYVATIEGRKKEARSLVELGLEMDPENISLHKIMAMDAMMRGQIGETARRYETAAGINPGDEGDLGRQGRYLQHPLMAPARLISRIGPVQLWLSWMVFIWFGRRYLPNAVVVPIVFAYLGLAIYSWTAPFLLRKWMERTGQL